MTPVDLHWTRKTQRCHALASIFDHTYLMVMTAEPTDEQPRRTIRPQKDPQKNSQKSRQQHAKSKDHH